MILGELPRDAAALPSAGGRITLDDLFRRAAQRHPDALALVDPPNRESFTDGKPRRLTYAQADRMISAIGGRLRRLGLPTDAVVAFQLPNTVESVLTLLGVLRGGFIAAPLPLLWRRGEASAALKRLDAKAVITAGQIGGVDHGALAMQVAADIFSVRYVCGFGRNLPDGMIPLDDLYGPERPDPIPALDRERKPIPALHTALVTWDLTADGLVPVARNHVELIAGGLAVLLESRIEQDAVILAAPMMSAFPGIASALVPWLTVGGTLVLNHPFDPKVFAAQCFSQRCDTAVLPGPLVQRLADAGALTARDGLKTVIAIWRAPERLANGAPWRVHGINLVDVPVFGEVALFASRRGAGGRPAPVPFGPLAAPRGATGGIFVLELNRSEAGTLTLRGPMIPRAGFPRGVERTSEPHFRTGANGSFDTGFTCRLDRETKAMVVTGPPPGIVGIGGYRFELRDLQDIVAAVPGGGGMLAALPDQLSGQRLAGTAPDHAGLQAALAAKGANPLLIGAFRERRSGQAT